MTRADSFTRLLCNLRWLAIAGQAFTIGVVTRGLDVALPLGPLIGGVAALTVFNAFATWQARRGEASQRFIVVQLLVDVAVLAWQIAWSGGIENPFSSLFLLPLALAVVALPGRWTAVVALASVAGYVASAALALDLPHLHHTVDAFSLHKAGMAVNFVVSAAVLLSFFARMASASRAKDREMARLREQFARNEGIVALATHAASVAHELNTPLATMTLMVEELEQAGGTPQQREDYATLRSLLDVCRDRVMELAAPAAGGEAGASPPRVDLERVIERWQLVRPAIELRRSGDIRGHESVEPAVGYLLQALLNNAADAGEKAGAARVDLDLRIEDGSLIGEISDYGSGFGKTPPVLPATLFRTDKPQRMGIGLALSHATVERLGGQLSMQAPAQGQGVRVAFRLPGLAAA